MQEYPRVTEVLQPFTNYDSVPRNILDRAAARGTTVHALCAGLAKGEWILDDMIEEEYRGYVQSFRLWADKQVKKFVLIEKRFNNEQYTGQIDMVVLGHDDELYLADLKTSSSPKKTYPVQMAAYRELLRQHRIIVKGVMLVYLDKGGEFPDIDAHEDLTCELNVFHAALECWQYFNKRKLYARNNHKEYTPANTGSDERT